MKLISPFGILESARTGLMALPRSPLYGPNEAELIKDADEIVDAAEAEVKEIEDQFSSGLVTAGEKYNKVIDIWSRANDKVSKAMMDRLSQEQVVDADGNATFSDNPCSGVLADTSCLEVVRFRELRSSGHEQFCLSTDFFCKSQQSNL